MGVTCAAQLTLINGFSERVLLECPSTPAQATGSSTLAVSPILTFRARSAVIAVATLGPPLIAALSQQFALQPQHLVVRYVLQ